jgi:hypothetical protein
MKTSKFLEAELVGRKQDVLAGRVEIGCPAHRAEVRDLPLVRAVQLHRPDVGDEAALVEPPPDDAGAVRGKEGASIVAGDGRRRLALDSPASVRMM